MRVKIVESLPELGGQLVAVYPEKLVYDIGGFRAVRAKDLAAALVEQALAQEPQVCLGEQVEQLTEDEEGMLHVITRSADHPARLVLVTAGIGSFAPRRIPAEDADAYEGRGVHYFVPSFERFAGRRVAVIGGGDTAIDWALAISDLAREVLVIHRRTGFRAQEGALQRLLGLPHVKLLAPAEVRRVQGGERVETIRVEWTQENRMEDIPVDDVVSGLGFVPNLGPMKSWGFRWEGPRIVVQPDSMETDRKHVFAAGDIVTYPGKVVLIATGFGEIAMAVARMRQILHPEAAPHLPHSSNMDHSKPLQ
jgi:thioredoxin reductase (NADPH)